MDNLYIRIYNEENDYEYVNKLINDNFGHSKEKCEVPSNVYQYVCLLEDKIVGYFIMTKIKNVVRGYDYNLVDYVCTDANLHGRGIGSFMVRTMIDLSNNDNVKYIQLTSSNKREAARHLYAKYGFKIHDTNVYRRDI